MSAPGTRPRARRRRRRRERRGRAIYLLPNVVTSVSLLLGFWSITLSIRGLYDRAALMIVLAAVCDMLDGRIARATRSTSAFGIEYDSIVDMVSFGMAPALLVYNWALMPLGPRAWIVAALFALCAALRLARFNVRAQTDSGVWYQGLPSTFAGLMVAASVWFVEWLGLVPPFDPPVALAITTSFAVVALLMVSSFPYLSLKILTFRGPRASNHLVAVLLGVVAVLLHPELMLFGLGILFILSGPVFWLYQRRAARLISEESSGDAG